MSLNFVVGQTEKHSVIFGYDKFFGRVSLLIDGRPFAGAVISGKTGSLERWEFDVGETERHRVRIEKRHAPLFGAFFPQPIVAFVDNHRVAEDTA